VPLDVVEVRVAGEEVTFFGSKPSLRMLFSMPWDIRTVPVSIMIRPCGVEIRYEAIPLAPT